MARPKRASLYKVDGVFYVSFWLDGKRFRESTGTNLRKKAEEIRLQREREMITGTVEIQQKVTVALADPRAREVILSALVPKSIVTLDDAKKEYLKQCEIFKRPKTYATVRGRLNECCTSGGFGSYKLSLMGVKFDKIRKVPRIVVNPLLDLRIPRRLFIREAIEHHFLLFLRRLDFTLGRHLLKLLQVLLRCLF